MAVHIQQQAHMACVRIIVTKPQTITYDITIIVIYVKYKFGLVITAKASFITPTKQKITMRKKTSARYMTKTIEVLNSQRTLCKSIFFKTRTENTVRKRDHDLNVSKKLFLEVDEKIVSIVSIVSMFACKPFEVPFLLRMKPLALICITSVHYYLFARNFSVSCHDCSPNGFSQILRVEENDKKCYSSA